jgi:hypothetical protein
MWAGSFVIPARLAFSTRVTPFISQKRLPSVSTQMGVYFCQSNGPWSKSFCGSANGRDSGKINLDKSTSWGASRILLDGRCFAREVSRTSPWGVNIDSDDA